MHRNEDIYDALRYPDHAGYKTIGTSQDAANAIEGSGKAGRLRAAVLSYYAARNGTPDQCAAFLGESPFSIRPRCSELFTAGKLMRTGERRKSSNGRSQSVLSLAPPPMTQAAA